MRLTHFITDLILALFRQHPYTEELRFLPAITIIAVAVVTVKAVKVWQNIAQMLFN